RRRARSRPPWSARRWRSSRRRRPEGGPPPDRGLNKANEEDLPVGARTKLNAAYLYGAALVAAAFGLTMQSWTAFVVALASASAGRVQAGDIRPRPRPR